MIVIVIVIVEVVEVVNDHTQDTVVFETRREDIDIVNILMKMIDILKDRDVLEDPERVDQEVQGEGEGHQVVRKVDQHGIAIGDASPTLQVCALVSLFGIKVSFRSSTQEKTS